MYAIRSYYEPVTSEPDPKKHVLAHVFKVTIDPFVGKIGTFRVHQGTITKDTSYNFV